MEGELAAVLAGLGLDPACWTAAPIREKDGVFLYRLTCGETSRVLKYFRGGEQRRELENYRILKRLGVPTVPLLGMTERALLMEDLAEHPRLRLGRREDLDDPAVAVGLAVWYRQLHDRGRDFVREHGAGLYDECDLIDPAALALAAERTGTADAPVWVWLEGRFGQVLEAIRGVGHTLAYNDFYYTNLAVERDGSGALMLDYGMLGRGYAYADLRNVTWHMGEDARAAFLAAYGPWDPREEAVDRVASTLTTLILASRREAWPEWGDEPLERVRGGALLRDAAELCGL